MKTTDDTSYLPFCFFNIDLVRGCFNLFALFVSASVWLDLSPLARFSPVSSSSGSDSVCALFLLFTSVVCLLIGVFCTLLFCWDFFLLDITFSLPFKFSKLWKKHEWITVIIITMQSLFFSNIKQSRTLNLCQWRHIQYVKYSLIWIEPTKEQHFCANFFKGQ